MAVIDGAVAQRVVLEVMVAEGHDLAIAEYYSGDMLWVEMICKGRGVVPGREAVFENGHWQ